MTTSSIGARIGKAARPVHGHAMLRLLVIGSLWLLAIAVCALAAIYFPAKAVLAPLPGEWSIPLRLVGPVQLQAGVPSLIRLATASWLGPVLHGRIIGTRSGTLHFGWEESTRTLAVRCSPCTLRTSALGGDAVTLDELRLTVRRDGGSIAGELGAGGLRAFWRGELAPDRLRLRIELPLTSIADGYELFHAAIPELAQARIEGRFGFTAQLSLPDSSLSIAPLVEGFQVSGLGTEALVTARSACDPGRDASTARADGRAVNRVSRLTADSWLAHAVVAAEDQRFYEHMGFDLVELAAAVTRNQVQPVMVSPNEPANRSPHGASTLSQQLARLLLTGSERSSVRKLRELLYAVEMERTLGKPRILQLYLAHAPWGPGLCGAEAAASRYFGRRAHDLTPVQAAWLAAMLHNPELEAARWVETGQINRARTEVVVLGMHALPRRQRLLLVKSLGDLRWPPPGQKSSTN